MSSNQLTDSSSSIQQQAIEKARLVLADVPFEDALFRQCASQADAVVDMVKALKSKYDSHRRRKRFALAQKFEQYTQWLQNFSRVVDVVVQTQAGIGCPIWAPVKFALQV